MRRFFFAVEVDGRKQTDKPCFVAGVAFARFTDKNLCSEEEVFLSSLVVHKSSGNGLSDLTPI